MTAARWFVTGAAGFIGFHLCRTLLHQGHEVVGFDNFLSGQRANIDRLQQLAEAARFRMVEGDIRDDRAVRSAMKGCRTAVNLAGQVAVQRSLDEPLETHEINATGFIIVHQAARDRGVERLIYASSCAVYGDNPSLPLGEAAEPRPRSPYAASKLANEHYAAGLAPRAGSLKVIGLRLFNVFGAWQPAAGGYAAVIPRWIDALLLGARPIIFGDGTASRDFVYVDDVCQAILRASAAPIREAAPVYNIGTGVRTQLNSLFRSVRAAAVAGGGPAGVEPPEYRPWRPGDIMHSLADNRKAASDLGFVPRVGLEDGLQRMLSEQHLEGKYWPASSSARSSGGSC